MIKIVYSVDRLELAKHSAGDFSLSIRDPTNPSYILSVVFGSYDSLLEALDTMANALFKEEGVEKPEEEDTVNHPKHYTQHPSGLEAIELIEHLPGNLFNAVKYIWRAGLKSTTTAKRDFEAALWYTLREQRRIRYFELQNVGQLDTDIVWRAHARRVIDATPNSTLGGYLQALLDDDWNSMFEELEAAIAAAEETKP